jgi:CoA:oxalate CoA-transferase
MDDERPPLDGITVIDMTANIAGPFATLTLQAMGARIIKIEPPGGDASRHWVPAAANTSAVFATFNRGKKSVQIDAKHPSGNALIKQLVAGADVFVESFRPGKMESIGLGWETLREVNPRLIYCSVNAFGDVGPEAGSPGFDAIMQAYSGLMDLTGEPDGPPCRVGGAVIDVGTGQWAAIQVAGALLQRNRDGRGRRTVATMLGTATGYLMHHLVATICTGTAPTRIGSAQHNFAPYEAIRTAGRMVMVGVNSDPMWHKFCAVIGDPTLASDSRFADNAARVANRRDLVAAVEESTLDVPAEIFVARLRDAGIPAAEVRGIADLAEDSQLEAVGLWALSEDGGRYPQVPVPWADVKAGVVPAAGQDTASVLAKFGLSRESVSELTEQGVIFAGGERR